MDHKNEEREKVDLFTPSLEFLQNSVSQDIQACTVKLIKKGANASNIYRISLQYNAGASGPATIIIKTLSTLWQNDLYGPIRETMVYREVLPVLMIPVPKVIFIGHDDEFEVTIIVLEDLEPEYYFPEPQHVWDWQEMRCLLQAYARLHSAWKKVPLSLENAPWLYPPWHKILNRVDLQGMIHDLVTKNIWQLIPGINHLIESTLMNIPHYVTCDPTFLHNDAYPPNVALPTNLDTEAILIDWGMASWGQAELDLSYLFMQPYRSTRMINRRKALEYYWQKRQVHGDIIPTMEERLRRQQHADAVMALALIPVAHRVAHQPYPTGSAPQSYWRAMFDVLQDKLWVLAERVLRSSPTESTW